MKIQNNPQFFFLQHKQLSKIYATEEFILSKPSLTIKNSKFPNRPTIEAGSQIQAREMM